MTKTEQQTTPRVRPTPRSADAVRGKEVVRLHRMGFSFSQIGAKFGDLSKQRIKQIWDEFKGPYQKGDLVSRHLTNVKG